MMVLLLRCSMWCLQSLPLVSRVRQVFDGVLLFGGMLLFGILLGLLIAGLFSTLLRFVKANEFVAVTILIVSAHVTLFLPSLLIMRGFWPARACRSIIAATVSSLFLVMSYLGVQRLIII